MTEELTALIAIHRCQFCVGEGVVHSRIPDSRLPYLGYMRRPVYTETHRPCPVCAGTGIKTVN